MSLDTRTLLATAAYLAIVALGMVGILLTSAEGSASPLVPLWLGFCGVSGTGLLSQRQTQAKVAELANGAMESKIRRVVGVELAKYATDPKRYAAEVHEGERQRARQAVIDRSA